MNQNEIISKISKKLEQTLSAEIRRQQAAKLSTQLSFENDIREFAREIEKLVAEFNGETVTAKTSPVAVIAAPRDWKTDGATAAQIALLRRMNVQIERGMSKGRASQLIDAARGGYIGSVSGFYTDGSN